MLEERADPIAGNRHRIVAAALILISIVALLKGYRRLCGVDPLSAIDGQPGGWLGALAVVVISGLVHEGIHAVALVLVGRVGWRELVIAPTWKKLGFAVRTSSPLSAAAFRFNCVAPFVSMGLIPAIVSLAAGVALPLLWSCFFILECFSDLTVLLATTSATSRVSGRPPADASAR